MNSDMAKGTSQAEAMLNNKAHSLSLHKSEGISQSVSQSVENFNKLIFFKYLTNTAPSSTRKFCIGQFTSWFAP